MLMERFEAKTDFPIGASVNLGALSRDPYPIYAALRSSEPVSWVPKLGMWFVTRADMTREILMRDEAFTTASPHSTIQDTFGANMLASDGLDHKRYRKPFVAAFSPGQIRRYLEPAIEDVVAVLASGFAGKPAVELRGEFASRLPIQTILMTFGLPLADERLFRKWYDDFEHALANFTGDDAIRVRARKSVAEFHAYLQAAIDERGRSGETNTLLGSVVNANKGERLTDEEIKRNLSIIFFGGISTVEALVLNATWALAHHRSILARVRNDTSLLPAVLDETMRWLSPVQSATRHVVNDIMFHGIQLRAGDTVNCMLGAANHDPAVFPEPEIFNVDRSNLAEQLGFATGPHMCIGFRLAKAEARIALEALLKIAPDLRLDPAGTSAPDGHEFRQPRVLTLLIKA